MGKLFAGALVLVLGGGVAASLGPLRMCWHRDVFPRDTARMQMLKLQAAIDMHYQDHKRLPISLEALTATSEKDPEPYLEEIAKDPWGNAFDYRPGGRSKFTLHSCGEDGQPGTDDDLTWPETQDPPGDGAAALPPTGPPLPHGR